MMTKKEKFILQLKERGCAVLVGPLFCEEDLSLVEDWPFLFVDGGFDKGLKHGLDLNKTVFSVGDGDSSKALLDEELPPEKDYSDLAYALSLLPKEVTSLKLLGFLGARKDHELSNLGEVFRYLKNTKTNTRVYLGESILALSSGDWKISQKGSFSIMSLEPLQLKLRGAAKYLLDDWTRFEPCSSHGLSNEGHGEIQLLTKNPAFLYGLGIKVK